MHAHEMENVFTFYNQKKEEIHYASFEKIFRLNNLKRQSRWTIIKIIDAVIIDFEIEDQRFIQELCSFFCSINVDQMSPSHIYCDFYNLISSKLGSFQRMIKGDERV